MKRLLITILLLLILPMGILYGKNGDNAKRLVDRIRIHGNDHITDLHIKEAMFTAESRWWRKRYFEMGLFQDDLNAIITLYNNRGFLDAKISAWDTTHVKTSRVRISITVNEGPQSKFGTVEYEGNQNIHPRLLTTQLQFKPGAPFSFIALSRSTWKLINLYANRGYLDAQVEPILEASQEVIDIRFQIREGAPVYTDTLIVIGNEKTNNNVIRRELRFHQGDLLTHQAIVESQQNLYKTGLFSSVSITPKQDSFNQQYRDVIIRLTEAQSGEFNFGVGYGSKEYVRGTAEILQSNLFGTGQRVGLRGKLSFTEQRIEGLFTAPYFLLWGIRLDNTMYYGREVEKNYTLNRLGSEATIGKDVFTFSRISSSLKLENNYYTRIDTVAVKDTADTRIRSISLNYTRDSRKNLFNTSSGSYLKLSGLVAGAIFAGTNSFFRLTGDYTKYYPVRPGITFAFNAATGTLFEVGNTRGIPVYERFYAGGDQSVRGYQDRSLSPQRGGKSIGGNFKAVLRMESRVKVYKGLHAALFVDTGNVWSAVDYTNLVNIRTGAGIGLRYGTPIGVARIDYGWKVNPRADESPGAIHITLGQAL